MEISSNFSQHCQAYLNCFCVVDFWPACYLHYVMFVWLCEFLHLKQTISGVSRYFQECTPVHYRGEFSFLGAMGYGICSTLGMLLGTNFMLGHSLILLTGIQVPPVIIHLIFLFTCLPETPKYLTIVRLVSLDYI